MFTFGDCCFRVNSVRPSPSWHLPANSLARCPRRWYISLQSACWTVVGLALCAELFSEIIIRWRPEAACFARASAGFEPWCVFDATVVALTVLAWGVMRVHKSSLVREEAEEADLWLLAIRFAMQPCRVLATARMARRAQQ